MSLAPSSTITRSGLRGSPSSVQPSRARPAWLVSPDTPPSATVAAMPWRRSVACKLRREAEPAIERHSRRSGCRRTPAPAGAAARRRRRRGAALIARDGEQDRPTAHRADVAPLPRRGKLPSYGRHDTRPSSRVADVNLTLGEGEVRTHILKSVSLTLDPGHQRRGARAVGVGQEQPDGGDRRARAARQRQRRAGRAGAWRRSTRTSWRGCAGARSGSSSSRSNCCRR